MTEVCIRLYCFQSTERHLKNAYQRIIVKVYKRTGEYKKLSKANILQHYVL